MLNLGLVLVVLGLLIGFGSFVCVARNVDNASNNPNSNFEETYRKSLKWICGVAIGGLMVVLGMAAVLYTQLK